MILEHTVCRRLSCRSRHRKSHTSFPSRRKDNHPRLVAIWKETCSQRPDFVISAGKKRKQFIWNMLPTGWKPSSCLDACSSAADCSRDSACVLRSSNSKPMVWPSLYTLKINSLDIGFRFRDLLRPARH